VCLYATITDPEPDEQFDMIFRVFALIPPERDEDTKEEYLMAQRFLKVGKNKLNLKVEYVNEFIG
jgi:hypothetical protein